MPSSDMWAETTGKPINTLDDKLREILMDVGVDDWKDETIAQIKQAFADEGYELAQNLRRAKLRQELESLKNEMYKKPPSPT